MVHREDTRRDHGDDHDGVLIGGHEEGTIEIVEYRAGWAERFEQEKARIEAAMGSMARRIEHVGSTAVPGLGAKPIVDVMVSVDDPDDESSYRPAMERAGYVLRVREPGHRMFRTPERDVHVHVWKAASDDEQRHIVFRDRLRSSADDRAEYEQNKRDLATQFRDMNAYADAKGALIERIVRRAGPGDRADTGVGVSKDDTVAPPREDCNMTGWQVNLAHRRQAGGRRPGSRAAHHSTTARSHTP